MRCFRLIEAMPGRSPLGYGIGPGRWNDFGVPMIYACSVSSLNFLELLSIKGPIVTQSAWQLIVLEIAAEIPELEIAELPKDWRNRPYPRSTQEFGSTWCKQFLSPVLKIPSCRIPLVNYQEEFNLLINPIHPDFNRIVSVKDVLDVSFEVNS
jgi:RES domain-containing protein